MLGPAAPLLGGQVAVGVDLGLKAGQRNAARAAVVVSRGSWRACIECAASRARRLRSAGERPCSALVGGKAEEVRLARISEVPFQGFRWGVWPRRS
jgi:hypothetical protein